VGLLAVVVCGCSDRTLTRRVAEEPEDAVLIVDRDAGPEGRRRVSTDPHAVLGVDPNHGSFLGGQLAIVRGNGFTSASRVWFGDELLSDEAVTSLDPNRLQVRVPQASPGPVDVSVQIEDDTSTRRTLADAYSYDAFSVEPGSGSTSGGTLVTLVGSGTGWTEQTKVMIDLVACEVIAVRELSGGRQELDCRTPLGSPGKKVVTTETPGEKKISVTGAFAYSESATDFEGGLSGEPLDGQLQVTLYDTLFGEPLAGASVFLGDPARAEELNQPEWIAVSDDSGLASFAGDLGPTQTVTVAGPCLQPITLVDVPVDTVTLTVDPILTPECIPPSLDIPQFRGHPGAAKLRLLHGELSWGQGIELKRASWRNVPTPLDETEEQVAYVFELASDSRAEFRLPNRFNVVTPDAPGALGYQYDFDTRSTGNLTLYAFAGIERRIGAQRVFSPYVMGLVKGVDPTDEEQRPIIAMDIILDHVVALDVSVPEMQPPSPDRVEFGLRLRLGRSGYIPLPQADRTELLPFSEPIEFVGVPPLVKALQGAQYVVTATAVTGLGERLPVADIEALATRSTDKPIDVDGFIEIPRLVEPEPGAAWDARALIADDSISGQFNLWVYRIEANGGLLSYQVIAPASTPLVELPDLTPFGSGIRPGPVSIRVSAARITDFDYSNLRGRSFGSNGWAAYSADVVSTYVP
jgi:hypothetical protein